MAEPTGTPPDPETDPIVVPPPGGASAPAEDPELVFRLPDPNPVATDDAEEEDPDAEEVPDDSMVTRNRTVRAQQFWIVVVLGVVGPIFAGYKIASDLFGYAPLGVLLGIVASALILKALIPRMIVSVESFSAFVTVNRLARKNPYVVYVTGDHFSLFWENRQANRNVDLTADDEMFEIPVLSNTGLVFLIGTAQLQPDVKNLITFLLKVAGLSGGLRNLLSAFMLEWSKGKSIQEVIEGVGPLNLKLSDEFVKGRRGSRHPQVSRFEKDFGVIASYFKVGQVRLSEDAERTRSGLDEAEIINRGTLKLLGSYNTLEEARADHRTPREIADARNSFMAATKNITMDRQLREYTLDVTGIDPEVVAAIAPFLPDIAAALRARQTTRQGGN